MHRGENGYQEKLKKELERLVNDGQNTSSRLTLEAKLIKKCKEIKPHLCENEKNIYDYFIINNSLFFIKGNEFITDSYFSLINNNIYKCFYELLLKPCQTQFEAFQIAFHNLEHGGDIIYLLSKKICHNLNMGEYDLFFSIIIKENAFRLEKLLHQMNITLKHEQIINKLKTFKKIKSNWSSVSLEDAYYFFLKAINNPQSIQNNEEINLLFNKEDNNRDKSNYRKDISTKNMKLNNSIFNENSISLRSCNDQVSSTKESINTNKFLEYLKKMKKIYENICPTPVLDYLIDNNGELKLEYFRYKEDKDSLVDHLYENLKHLIYKLKIGDFTDETNGYFCYKDESTNTYIESLYSKVELNLLFDKITFDQNFLRDDFMNPDKIKTKNAFKSQTLSFEFYINFIIINEKFKMKEWPRVIYPFKSLEAFTEKEEEKEKEKSNNLIEVNGVILEKKGYVLTLEKKAFILDKLYKFEEFTTINKQKAVEPYIEKDINLVENEICIIEIKNQFLSSINRTELSDGESSYSKIIVPNEKQPTSFYQIVKDMIKKSKIFKQLYDFKKEKVDKIRLLLFYDIIQKENYFEDLKRAFSDSFNQNDKSQFLYEFQCIYIKSSYLAAGLFNQDDKINFLYYMNKTLNESFEKMKDENTKLKEDLNELKEKMSNFPIEQKNFTKEFTKKTLKQSLQNDKNYFSPKEYFEETLKLKQQIIDSSKEISRLKKEFNNYQKKKFEETSNLEKEIINDLKEIQKLKDQLITNQAQNLKEIQKLRDEINESSKNVIKLKEQIINNKIESKKENFMLKEKINILTDENNSLKEDLLKFEKNNQELLNSMEGITNSEKFTEIEKLDRLNKIKRLISDILNLKIEKEEGEKKIEDLLFKK